MTQEQIRSQEARKGTCNWKKWGPCCMTASVATVP